MNVANELSRFILKEHGAKRILLTPKQISMPWNWHGVQKEYVDPDGKRALGTQIVSVEIPADLNKPDSQKYFFTVNDIRW